MKKNEKRVFSWKKFSIFILIIVTLVLFSYINLINYISYLNSNNLNFKNDSFIQKEFKLQKLNGEINFASGILKNNTLELKTKNSPIQEIIFYDFKINNVNEYELKENLENEDKLKNIQLNSLINLNLKIDELNKSKFETENFNKVFSIDPSNINFSIAKIKLNATATSLYKCELWNYSEEKCYGDWILFKSLTNGTKKISFNITSGDPVFGFGKDPKIYCGNNICENIENCNNCKKDCGSCKKNPKSGIHGLLKNITVFNNTITNYSEKTINNGTEIKDLIISKFNDDKNISIIIYNKNEKLINPKLILNFSFKDKKFEKIYNNKMYGYDLNIIGFKPRENSPESKLLIYDLPDLEKNTLFIKNIKYSDISYYYDDLNIMIESDGKITKSYKESLISENSKKDLNKILIYDEKLKNYELFIKFEDQYLISETISKNELQNNYMNITTKSKNISCKTYYIELSFNKNKKTIFTDLIKIDNLSKTENKYLYQSFEINDYFKNSELDISIICKNIIVDRIIFDINK